MQGPGAAALRMQFKHLDVPPLGNGLQQFSIVPTRMCESGTAGNISTTINAAVHVRYVIKRYTTCGPP